MASSGHSSKVSELIDEATFPATESLDVLPVRTSPSPAPSESSSELCKVRIGMSKGEDALLDKEIGPVLLDN